jgi:hypothetical protein
MQYIQISLPLVVRPQACCEGPERRGTAFLPLLYALIAKNIYKEEYYL